MRREENSMKCLAARSLGGLALVLLFALPARADLLSLADGREIEGEIVKESADEITVKTGSITLTVPRSQIKSIEKRLTPAKEYEARREKLRPDDVAGRVELAKFALEKRLPPIK